MASGVALNSNAPVSNFSIPSSFHFLTSKVNGVFGVYLAVVVSYFVYYASRCYQWSMNPSSQLDDQLKVIRCKILLGDIKNILKNNEDVDVTALLKECEALHKSIANTTNDPFVSENKSTISMGLFECYLKKDPEQAYQIAQGFSSEEMLFDAYQALTQAKSAFNSDKRSILLNQAYKAHGAQRNNLAEVESLLRYALPALCLEESALLNTVLQQAMKVAAKCGVCLDQVEAWRAIAQVCKDLHYDESFWRDSEQFKSFLNQAKIACENKDLSAADSFIAHLSLVKANFLCGGNTKEVLEAADKLFYSQRVYQDADVLALLYFDIERSKDAQMVLDTAYMDLQNQNNIPSNKDVRAYLRLANAYPKCGMQGKVNAVLACATKVIERLPEKSNVEIYSKINLFVEVSSKALSQEQARVMLGSLQLLHSKCSLDGTFEKLSVQLIFEFCTKNHLEEESNQFFESYFLGLINSKQDAGAKIVELTSFAKYSLTFPQRARVIRAAEGFLSKVRSCNEMAMTAEIAEGFLGVNPEESRKLLNSYTKGQARIHLLQAAIPLIAMPVFLAFPMVGIACAAVSPLIRQLMFHRF
jgi:hypothetical protein